MDEPYFVSAHVRQADAEPRVVRKNMSIGELSGFLVGLAHGLEGTKDNPPIFMLDVSTRRG